jgi:hypothetical protein
VTLAKKIYVSSASSCWKTDEAICQKKIKPRKKQKYFRWRKKIVNKGVKFLCLIEQCDEYCIQIKNWRAEQNLLLFNFIEKNCWWYRCKKSQLFEFWSEGKTLRTRNRAEIVFVFANTKRGHGYHIVVVVGRGGNCWCKCICLKWKSIILIKIVTKLCILKICKDVSVHFLSFSYLIW